MVDKAKKQRAVNAAHATVLDLLRLYRMRPIHRHGQNFLVDDLVYDDILAAASLSSKDTVLEIGPGLGTLTERLSPLARRVVAVELDKQLAAIISRRLKDCPNLTIIERNILASPVADFGITPPYKVVANIPYSITGAILKKFITSDVQPVSMTVMVQREVAERVTAKPGQMSLLALSVRLYAEPKIIRFVPAACFYPAPEVASAILNVTNIRPFPFKDIDEEMFWRVARVGFSAKRKQLHNNLSAGFPPLDKTVKKILTLARISPQARAEDLSIENWHNVAKLIQTALGPEH